MATLPCTDKAVSATSPSRFVQSSSTCRRADGLSSKPLFHDDNILPSLLLLLLLLPPMLWIRCVELAAEEVGVLTGLLLASLALACFPRVNASRDSNKFAALSNSHGVKWAPGRDGHRMHATARNGTRLAGGGGGAGADDDDGSEPSPSAVLTAAASSLEGLRASLTAPQHTRRAARAPNELRSDGGNTNEDGVTGNDGNDGNDDDGDDAEGSPLAGGDDANESDSGGGGDDKIHSAAASSTVITNGAAFANSLLLAAS
mmetsp:Transcript_54791/g.102650  ORF Transcript_54791/g.102650 Transcript_54791/m.102650 type:complete len:259 (-) Transcript_54791:1030-1806(-)